MTMMNRRRATQALGPAWLLPAGHGARAQAPWPNKPIRYIAPFAPGGTTDILARVVGEKLGPALGTTHQFARHQRQPVCQAALRPRHQLCAHHAACHAAVAVDNIATALPHMKAGKLRALAVTTAQRSSAAPDVPTFAEAGLPGYELSSWQAVFAPAGTPAAIVERPYVEIGRILTTPEVSKRLSELGLDLSGMAPAELAALVKADVPRLGTVVRDSGAKAE